MASGGTTADYVAKGEDGGTTVVKEQVGLHEDVKSTGLDSLSQTREETKPLLTDGIGKGDVGFESGIIPIESSKLSAMDAAEKRGQFLSRQNSDRGGGNGENGITVEGKTGETKQEANEIQVSCFYLSPHHSHNTKIPFFPRSR